MSGSPGLVYTVRDRSLLLPIYKRLFVEPALPYIPARVDPNLITHVGHAINLAGLVALLTIHSNWRFAIAALCLQLYNFCDNVDGAHARRVKRCSALGELLDHGLDMLNTTYIAFIAAIAIGAPPPWFSAIAIVIPAACAATYWEQAETGVFNLGLLNQIESVFLLSAVLVVSTVFGVDVYAGWPRLVVMGFVCATALVGIARNVFRARAHAFGVAPLLLLDAAAFIASATGAVSPILAVVAATAGNVFFGVRCLALRTSGKKPTREPGMVFVALGLLAFVIAAALRHPASASLAFAGAMLASVFFASLAFANARVALRAVTRPR